MLCLVPYVTNESAVLVESCLFETILEKGLLFNLVKALGYCPSSKLNTTVYMFFANLYDWRLCPIE